MNKIFIYMILMATLLVFHGCKKELDKLPENAKVEGNAITDQPSALVALNGVYFRFANASNTRTDWSANQLMGGLFSGYLGNATGGNNDELNAFEYTNYTSEWGRYYVLVNAANGVISAVEKLPDNKFTTGKKQQILGEAKFLRAYGHFKLLSFFGQWFDINSKYGIILRNEFVNLTNKDQPRSTVKESYNFILSDIDDAISNTPVANENVYASKWTAMALKMRVLLSRGQGDDYTQTSTLGKAIIAESPFVLEPNLRDLFQTKGLASKEVMLGIKPQSNQDLNYENMSGNFIGRSYIYAAKPALISLYENDLRKTWIIGNQYKTSGLYHFVKFIQPAMVSTIISETAYAFRLTEVYLMLAEATVRAGGDFTVARTHLKEVLAHAGVTDTAPVDAATTQDQLLMQIYLEYTRNMIGEDGIEWMALLRLPFATVQAIRPTITDKIQYILPIPRAEFLNNTKIVDQNPGYTRN
ncbi:RagB/SusD family nutrient uptake outer membrane protein [Pedobacter sp.]|uniref:RagB/SusD family nutrient uptake outer membrane protein n=1 Tax=Pedobacter sp. TaxID=1411316 RepID=UPI003D7F37C2